MKTLLISTAFALMAMPAVAEDTMMFDGCLAVKVEGANYYNFATPGCVTVSALYSSTGADEKRQARAARAEEEEGCPKT